MSRFLVFMLACSVLCLGQLPKDSAPSAPSGIVQSTNPQTAKRLAGLFHNERLKRKVDDDYSISGDNDFRGVSGIWIEESGDPSKALLFPEQVSITCTRSEMTCQEMKVTLEPTNGLVFIAGPDETIWPITSWDAHGLLASYGPEISATTAASDRCHRHVLAMSFASGAVSTSDIPTHEKGCEAFAETNSYRLARGQYYFDSSPGNDMDKPLPRTRK